MCIFSANVSSVANTSIFARSSGDNRQFLVYSMQYEANSDLAMILPLPTPPLPDEEAVRFIDLANYPQFFDDMAEGFILPPSRGLSSDSKLASKSILKVHDVGSFQASFVPHRRDFARLDDRFRLPDQAWDQIPQYDDYAFAVFKLRAGAKSVHPMAFEFPRRNQQELFFPTVHIHHGVVEAQAEFDHSLYCQTLRGPAGWRISADEFRGVAPLLARQFMDIAKTEGIVDADSPVLMRRLQGIYINADIIVQDGV
jgi:hypothetical protein